MASKPTGKKVRYAVVGAGWFGQSAVLPAFANAKENSELAAIVSGDAEKRAILSSDYGVPAYSYEEYEDLLGSGAVDAVYVVSPNSLHRDHAVAAARHGIHVLCEKPLADTAVAAEEMIAACDRAGVHLMTAYRLHFEKANLQAIDLIRKGTIGEPRVMTSTFTQQVDPDNSRLDANLGGHPLLDMGVYCVNAARYLFRAEPIEVTAFAATGNDPRFAKVPEMVSAVMRFPGERLASFVCGFGEAKASAYQVLGTKGDIRLDPAFAHKGERAMTVTVDGKAKDDEVPGLRPDRPGDRVLLRLHPEGPAAGAGRPRGAHRPVDHRGDQGVGHEGDGGPVPTGAGEAAAGQGPAHRQAGRRRSRSW